MCATATFRFARHTIDRVGVLPIFLKNRAHLATEGAARPFISELTMASQQSAVGTAGVVGETAVACGFLFAGGFAAYHTVRDCGWAAGLRGYAKASMQARVWLAMLMACGCACRAATFFLSAFD